MWQILAGKISNHFTSYYKCSFTERGFPFKDTYHSLETIKNSEKGHYLFFSHIFISGTHIPMPERSPVSILGNKVYVKKNMPIK